VISLTTAALRLASAYSLGALKMQDLKMQQYYLFAIAWLDNGGAWAYAGAKKKKYIK